MKGKNKVSFNSPKTKKNKFFATSNILSSQSSQENIWKYFNYLIYNCINKLVIYINSHFCYFKELKNIFFVIYSHFLK